MSAVRTIRRRFTVGRYRATLSVQLAAGIPLSLIHISEPTRPY